MKRLFCVLLLTALILPAPLALAGASCSGFDCANACPLARTANLHRAAGDEAVQASETLRGDFTAEVLLRLDRI